MDGASAATRAGIARPSTRLLTAGVTLAVGVAVAIFASPARGANSVVNFDDINAVNTNTYTNATPFDGSRYASQGITFANPNGDGMYIAPASAGFWNASNSLSILRFPYDPDPSDGANDDLVVTLDPPRSYVGFTVIDSSAAPGESIKFKDAGGALIKQMPIPSSSYRATVELTSEDRPVARVEIDEAGNDFDDIAYDDFTFTSFAPPTARVASAAFPLNERSAAARADLRSQYESLIGQRNAVQGQLDLAVRTALEARKDHRFYLNNLETIQANLKDLENGGFTQADQKPLHDLLDDLREATIAELASRLKLVNRDREASELVGQRRALDQQLLPFAQAIQSLDFELTGLEVSADGTPVYRVALGSPYPKIADLGEQAAELRAVLAKLDAVQKEAFGVFRQANSAATAQLVRVAKLIARNGWIKLTSDFGFIAIDVGVAASKGGWAGVGTELVSKLVEQYVKKELLDWKFTGSPITGRDQVNAWFARSAWESVKDDGGRVGGERFLKATVGKTAKDFLGERLSGWFPDLLHNPVTGELAQTPAKAALDRARSMLARLKDLQPKVAEETFRKGFKEWAKAGLGRAILQDVAKTLLKKKLIEQSEMEKWREFWALEVRSQATYALWYAAANASFEAYSNVEKIENEIAELVRAFDPATGLTTTLQSDFPRPTTLTVRLSVPNSKLPFAQVPVKVFVGGVEATRSATDPAEFTVPGAALPEAQLTTLGIEVR